MIICSRADRILHKLAATQDTYNLLILMMQSNRKHADNRLLAPDVVLPDDAVTH